MTIRPQPNLKNRAPAKHNADVLSRRSRRGLRIVNRMPVLNESQNGLYLPAEDWHEPTGKTGTGYRIIVQEPGEGYRHVVTPDEIRQRLSLLPSYMLQSLEVIQLSELTRKKKRFPCYGMQWGNAVYLYPMEAEFVEYFGRPPRPSQWNEARMYGGRLVDDSPNGWRLIWTEQALKDFYLNNVLIHELAHLLDDRNSNYVDRERYAEWFAIRYGYQSPQRRSALAQKAARKIVRRRHSRKK